MTGNWKKRITAAGLLCLLAGSSAVAQEAPRAHVSGGELAGVRQGAAAAYLGVPFAAPPIGPNRWRSPQPAASWNGVKKADHFSASCMQPVDPKGREPWTHEFMVQGPVSEDCLYLNVWTAARPGARLPVLFWIHGGGFREGSSSIAIYNGAPLAAQGVVVVTINYRIGALGFLAHPELTQEAAGGPIGNYGLQDMVAALKWVHENIAAFGGDPDSITIDGQSAGAMAVHDLVVSPLAKGLFKRAIAQSGMPSVGRTASLKEAEQAGLAFARSKGAASLKELRALPPEKLISAPDSGAPSFGPIVDGVLLPDSPIALVRQGHSQDTPMMVGLAADDPSSLRPGWGSGDAGSFKALMERTYGPMAEKFSSFYPASTDQARSEASKQVLRDQGLASIYSWSQDRLAHGHAPVFAYQWDHLEPGPESSHWGVFHSSEIPYVFGTLDTAPERGFTENDRQVSKRISAYWLNFIKTGDPNGGSLPKWPQLSKDRPLIMSIGDKAAERPILSSDKLAAVQQFVAEGGQPRPF